MEIEPLSDGRFHVVVKPDDIGTFIPRSQTVTSFEPQLIAEFARRSFAWLCDSLARHDDAGYVRRYVGGQVLAYLDSSELRNKRLLDFGCGTGASSLCLAAMFPETEIVGIDLDEQAIDLARKVLAHRGLTNVKFLSSCDPASIPRELGEFDFVMLSAVYEHLLPEERHQLMPELWRILKVGGVLFINQTPHRYFPYEHHSTRLWLLNYLPDVVAFFLARHFSKINPELNRSGDWQVHLRGGIRGGSEAEICSHLRRTGLGRPRIIQPRSLDRAAYWLSCTSADRYQLTKRLIASFYRVTDRFWQTVPSLNLDVVIRKDLQ